MPSKINKQLYGAREKGKFHLPDSLCIFITGATGFPWRSSWELKHEEWHTKCGVRTDMGAQREPCTHISAADPAQRGLGPAQRPQRSDWGQNPPQQRHLWKKHLTFARSNWEMLFWTSVPTVAGQAYTRPHPSRCTAWTHDVSCWGPWQSKVHVHKATG